MRIMLATIIPYISEVINPRSVAYNGFSGISKIHFGSKHEYDISEKGILHYQKNKRDHIQFRSVYYQDTILRTYSLHKHSGM